MPRDLPPGGEDQRFAEFPSHLQRHQWDSNEHAGSRHDQLVLRGVTSPRGPRVGTCFVICKLRMISRANHWARAGHGRPSTGNGRGECGRREMKSRVISFHGRFSGGVLRECTYFFKPCWQYSTFSLCLNRGMWWTLLSWS